ncbi:MAG: hypothetical protein ACLSX5_00835 [Lachnospiraceae bacterium]
MNPIELMGLQKKALAFKENHPKFINFLQAVSQKDLTEGTIMEVTLTAPTGEHMSANLKLTASDIELIRSLAELQKNNTCFVYKIFKPDHTMSVNKR